jgi:hypothetical protein
LLEALSGEGDKDLLALVQRTAVTMLHHNQTSGIQTAGIGVANTVSQMQDDPVFLAMMWLLNDPKCKAETRKKIIKSLKNPLSPTALIMLGRRLRDKNEGVCLQVWKQLIECGVKIEDFDSKEQRMLVLGEGLQHHDDQVREMCLKFLEPSVIQNKQDLSYLLGLCDLRIAFTD